MQELPYCNYGTRVKRSCLHEKMWSNTFAPNIIIITINMELHKISKNWNKPKKLDYGSD